MATVALPQAAFAAGVVAAQGEREQAFVAQPVAVAEVLRAERDPEPAVGEQALQGMLATARIAVIDVAGGQVPCQAGALVDGIRQGAAIGGHAAAVKAGAHLAAALIGEIDCESACAHGVCL